MLWRTAPGFLALCHVDGTSLAVGGPGADVWELLAVPATLDGITAELATRYAAPKATVRGDVERFLAALIEAGYVVDVP